MGARRSHFLLPLPMLMLSLSAAQAEESTPAAALVAESQRPLLSEPESRDSEEAGGPWEPQVETRAWRGLYLNKSGLEIRRPLQLGERRFELGLKGPLMKRKRVGLKLELRF